MIKAPTGKPVLLAYGGTFDPVHCGHIAVARAARDLMQAPLALLPNRQPPHRGQPSAAPEHRLAMLQLAFAGEPSISIDQRELQRDGPSYMVDTLADLRSEVGHGSALVLVLGADAFLGLPGWCRWREICALASILVASRPGVSLEPLPSELAREWDTRRVSDAQELREHAAGRWAAFEVPPWAVSSSLIRKTLGSNGRLSEASIPAAVETYIRAHALYRDSGDPETPD